MHTDSTTATQQHPTSFDTDLGNHAMHNIIYRTAIVITP